MFLNFPLDETIKPYCGVNLTCFADDLNFPSSSPRLRWNRTWMGFRPSPYLAIRHLAISEEFVRGDRLNPLNPFKFDRVILNLPCSSEFDPTMPWIYKWNSEAQRMSGDLVSFVDDLRVTGYSIEHCWQCARYASSIIQWRGIQEAARKRTAPTLLADAWAGCVAKTQGVVEKTITQAKWIKTKKYLEELKDLIGTPDHPRAVPLKALERVRGFLNHISLTYEIVVPFLRGFHNSIDSWRDNRDEEGWKVDDSNTKWEDVLEHLVIQEKISEDVYENLLSSKHSKEQAPKFVMPVPRLRDDLYMLDGIFSGDIPSKFPIRFSKFAVVMYGFVDASGRGLGSMVQDEDESGLHVRMGVWSTTLTKERSSNWKEFSNLVQTVKDQARRRKLINSVLFMFTDSSTVELAVAKGNSPSRRLFELVRELKMLQMQCSFSLFVIHVSGTRMIEQGTDGTSRGDLQGGSLNGRPIREFAPLHLTALERNKDLKDWIKSWIGQKCWFLKPEHWYSEAHDVRYTSDQGGGKRLTYESTTYVWTPPPSVADAAIEQLRYARIKRQSSIHVFVVPKLFFSLWRRQLYKEADLILFLPPQFSFWPCCMHEPLIIAFCFPFLRHEPWTVRKTPKLLSLGRELQAMWKKRNLDGGDILCKFLLEARKFPSLPKSLVRKVLYFEH